MTLSELVAVEAMGWTKERKGGWEAWWDYESIVKVRKCLAHYWNPDTNIADAWRVVEKVGGTFDCGSPYVFIYQQAPAWARFGGNLAEPSGANTIPEAICLAALRACGVSDDRIEKARKGNT